MTYPANRIHILMVLGNTGRGGAQAFLLNLLQSIDLNRFQIDFAVNEEKKDGIGDDVRALGCKIHILPFFKVYNYYHYVKSWRNFLKSHHYDIVHGHSTNSAAVYFKIAKEAGCITIAHSHSAGFRGSKVQQVVKKIFAKKTKKYADYWFACSDQAALRLYGEHYNDNEKYAFIPNAIRAETYRYNDDVACKIRKELGINPDEILCGHVGTFSTPKNHLFLLEIFNEVLKINQHSKLICCGSGYLEGAVKEKVTSLGIQDSVIFTGVVNNVHEYMMAMDVFIFPSLFEGFPMSVIEAQAAGLPVVMSSAITDEVIQTDLVKKLSLKQSATEWASIVCQTKSNRREEYNEVISNSIYNMKSSIGIITSLYLKMINDKKDERAI